MTEPTRFTSVEIKEDIKVDEIATEKLILDVISVESAADKSLGGVNGSVVLGKMTAASKTFTLNADEGQLVIITNVGTNTFTVKNITADTGTSLATGLSLMIIASKGTNKSVVIPLNQAV